MKRGESAQVEFRTASGRDSRINCAVEICSVQQNEGKCEGGGEGVKGGNRC